jgi:hypothetical protein
MADANKSEKGVHNGQITENLLTKQKMLGDVRFND